MIEFHIVSVADRQWIMPRLSSRSNLCCEYTFGNIFGYGAKHDVFVADHNENLVIKYVCDDTILYAYPIGQGDKEYTLKQMELDAKIEDMPAYITSMNKEDAKTFEKVFNGKYSTLADRDSFDYVYSAQDLINLSGKKYQSKRNHISFFRRTYNWTYEKITADNINECISMNEKWLNHSSTEFHEDLLEEYKIIKRIFENYDALDFVGGLIRIDGEVVAYTMGERLDSQTFCTHFEKAYGDIRGAYPIINQQFAENELSGYKYINREDDVGAENLRKAKLSYHPEFLLEKYTAKIN